jgi:hypothetical protein
VIGPSLALLLSGAPVLGPSAPAPDPAARLFPAVVVSGPLPWKEAPEPSRVRPAPAGTVLAGPNLAGPNLAGPDLAPALTVTAAIESEKEH